MTANSAANGSPRASRPCGSSTTSSDISDLDATGMQIGICSYSFHRLLAAGKQDVFRFITVCKELGCTQLDPWNAHLSAFKDGEAVLHAGHNPSESHHLTAMDEGYIDR